MKQFVIALAPLNKIHLQTS